MVWFRVLIAQMPVCVGLSPVPEFRSLEKSQTGQSTCITHHGCSRQVVIRPEMRGAGGLDEGGGSGHGAEWRDVRDI